MTGRALRICSVVGGRFGRFSGRQIDLAPGLCVVHGRNESGKSTLSELIAWLLAGIDDAQIGRTQRYGAVGDVLDGRLIADLDGRSLTIERGFNIRSDRRGSVIAHEAVRLDGSVLPVDELRSLLAIPSADEFERRYRITDSAGFHSVSDLLAHHGLGLDAERSPTRLVEDLAERAGRIVPGPDDRRRNSDAHTARAGGVRARSDRAEALGAASTLESLRREREHLESGIAGLRSRREAVASQLSDLRLVDRLLETRHRLGVERASLAALAVTDPEQTVLVTRRAEIAAAVASLRAALTAASEAAEQAHRQMAGHALDAGQLSGVSVPDGTEQRVVQAQVELAAARQLQREATETIRRLGLERTEYHDRFAEVVSDVGVTEEVARRFASVNDTVVFDGPLQAWEQADRQVIAAESELARVRAELDAATAEVENRRADFEGVGGGDPIQVAAGLADPAGRSRRSLLVPAVLAVAMVGSGLAALVEPLASAVGAVVIVLLGGVWFVRSARSAASPAEVASSDSELRRQYAGHLLAALDHARIAERDLETATTDLERHRAAAERHRAELAELHERLGLPAVDSLQHARVLRSRHRELVRLVEHLDGSDRAVAAATADGAAASTRITAAEDALAVIATEIGLPGRGAVLDGEKVAALRAVCVARDADAASAQRVLEIRRDLLDLSGSDRIAALDPGSIDAELVAASAVDDERAAADAEIHRLERELRSATDDRPGAADLLAEDGLSAEILSVRIAAADADMVQLDETETASRERIAELNNSIRMLEDRSDLPAIEYRLAQADEDLVEIVRRGAAAHFAHRLVSGIKDDFERRSQPELVQRAAALAATATGGEWAGLVVDDDRRHFVVVRRDAARFAETQLSAGAMELLRLAVRIAVAESHGSTYGISLPLICDDPTGDIDQVRSPRVWAMLAEAARQRQILVFTHDPRTVELASSVGASTVAMSD